MIIAIDFDGTIVEDAFPKIGAERNNAAACIRALKEMDHTIILWTCRSGERLTDAINWLLEHNIPFDRVNEHCPNNLAQYGDKPPGTRKVYADVYIDDKAIGGIPTWNEIFDTLACKM